MTKQTKALKMAHKSFMQLNERHPRRDNGEGYFDKEIQACKEALEQPAQEIVHKVFDIDNFHSSVLDRIKFTSPQQWQGLNDDEIAVIIGNGAFYELGDLEFARAIEQELKTKNGFSALKEKNNV
jgi:hypothetical protein